MLCGFLIFIIPIHITFFGVCGVDLLFDGIALTTLPARCLINNMEKYIRSVAVMAKETVQRSCRVLPKSVPNRSARSAIPVVQSDSI